jgi:hypothetical protein
MTALSCKSPSPRAPSPLSPEGILLLTRLLTLASGCHSAVTIARDLQASNHSPETIAELATFLDHLAKELTMRRGSNGYGRPPNPNYAAVLEQILKNGGTAPHGEREWRPWYHMAQVAVDDYNQRRSFRQAIKNALKRFRERRGRAPASVMEASSCGETGR